MLEAGRVVAGKYRLERPLARGGMGHVWVATHVSLDAHVAIKFIEPSLVASREVRMRFDREARALAQVRSRHIVHVMDHGSDLDAPYLVMDLLEGEDLGTRLKRIGRLALPAAVGLIGQLCKGLQTAHDKGLVHRDLKPGNVFLAREDDEEVAKILDFGLAKVLSRAPEADGAPTGESTRTGMLMGSPSYMSPEQARGLRSVDHRTDLWSMALIAYRAITGRPPYTGESDADIIVKVCTQLPARASSVAPDLPPTLDAFFERALVRDPEARFASARELAAAFEAAVVTARHPVSAALADARAPQSRAVPTELPTALPRDTLTLPARTPSWDVAPLPEHETTALLPQSPVAAPQVDPTWPVPPEHAARSTSGIALGQSPAAPPSRISPKGTAILLLLTLGLTSAAASWLWLRPIDAPAAATDPAGGPTGAPAALTPPPPPPEPDTAPAVAEAPTSPPPVPAAPTSAAAASATAAAATAPPAATKRDPAAAPAAKASSATPRRKDGIFEAERER